MYVYIYQPTISVFYIYIEITFLPHCFDFRVLLLTLSMYQPSGFKFKPLITLITKVNSLFLFSNRIRPSGFWILILGMNLFPKRTKTTTPHPRFWKVSCPVITRNLDLVKEGQGHIEWMVRWHDGTIFLLWVSFRTLGAAPRHYWLLAIIYLYDESSEKEITPGAKRIRIDCFVLFLL
jgi:hypothetical protein